MPSRTDSPLTGPPVVTPTITIDEILDEFEFLGEWEDQCKYLIELGEELPDLAPDEKTDAFRVRGCQSNVWFVPEVHEEDGRPRIEVRAKSDARIVDGLIAVLLSMANGRTAEEILETDFEGTFRRLGLETHLVPQRRNGLFSMVERMRSFARVAAGRDEEVLDAERPPIVEPQLPVSDADEEGRPPRHLDVEAVRRDFPILDVRSPSGGPITFLDTAASSQKPRVVIDKEREVYERYYANGYRGVYHFGDRVSREMEESREAIREFIGAAHIEEIVFTPGCTASINLVAQAWGRKFLEPGDEVLVNVLEHHANLVPWQFVAEKTGARLRYVPLTPDGQLDLDGLDDLLSDRTRLVAVTGMSNVLGTVPPVGEIVRKAKRVGALVAVDGAQSVPHMPTKVARSGVDFLAFSGHKLYGPTGVGVLYGRRDLLEAMDPFLCGGHMIDRVTTEGFTTARLPAKFEAGTLPIAQAIALGTAVEYVNGLGLCAIHEHEQRVLRYAHERLAEVPGLTILGPTPDHKGAIVAFTLEEASPYDVAVQLDLGGVCVRHGHHCTMPLHDHLGIPASVRASIGVYNTTADVDTLVAGLHAARGALKLG